MGAQVRCMPSGRAVLVAAIATAVMAFGGAPLAAPRFIAVPLGTLGGASSFASGINDHGELTGSADIASGVRHAFLWTSGSMRDLGTLGGTNSWGAAINARGQVTGMADSAPGVSHVFLYSAGTMIDLGALGGDWGRGSAINESAEITGQFDAGGMRALHAFLYSAGTMTDLGTNGDDFSEGVGINARGHVAVNTYGRLPRSRAFIYADGMMTDIGSLGGGYTSATAINAADAITGISEMADGEPRAFLYAAGTIIDLGQPGAGRALNDHGQVVGESRITRAFLHTHGTAHDLTALVVEGLAPGEWLAYAGGINNAGQIAATATTEGFSRTLAYRLDPVPLAIEYYHAGDDLYFVTASPTEIAAFDAGGIAGWRRTGGMFGVYPMSVRDGAAMCRFRSAQTFAPKRSRFYTPYAAECAVLKVDPNWVFEGQVFATRLPDPTGRCAGPMVPLYRLYNDGKGGAPNHRYTTSAAVRVEMVAKGWIPEGVGNGVSGCVLPP